MQALFDAPLNTCHSYALVCWPGPTRILVARWLHKLLPRGRLTGITNGRARLRNCCLIPTHGVDHFVEL